MVLRITYTYPIKILLSKSRFYMHPSSHSDYQKLFAIFSEEQPDFIKPFLEADVVSRLEHISQSCGLNYTKLYDFVFGQTRLEHSIGVALIIRHFTKDKKATLAWLFHDISHSVFSHVGDFLLWDAQNQESSEQHTTHLLQNDYVITHELAKLWISILEVDDYTLYPIADNDWPQLSADRLEYTLSTPIVMNSQSLQEIADIYNNIIVLENEHGIDELWFTSQAMAEKLAIISIQNDSSCFSNHKSVLWMSLMADMLKYMMRQDLVTHMDLYTLRDTDIFAIIRSEWDETLKTMRKQISTITSYKIFENKPTTSNFVVHARCKKRYIDPLVKTQQWVQRISELSDTFKDLRDTHLAVRDERIATDFVFGK